jgi:hypothetical protein
MNTTHPLKTLTYRDSERGAREGGADRTDLSALPSPSLSREAAGPRSLPALCSRPLRPCRRIVEAWRLGPPAAPTLRISLIHFYRVG